eukprot:3227775-Rhodomonas_salina.4
MVVPELSFNAFGHWFWAFVRVYAALFAYAMPTPPHIGAAFAKRCLLLTSACAASRLSRYLCLRWPSTRSLVPPPSLPLVLCATPCPVLTHYAMLLRAWCSEPRTAVG